MAVSRQVAEPIVLVDGLHNTGITVLEVHRSTGGHQMDSAVLEYDLSEEVLERGLFQDTTLKDEFHFKGRNIEVLQTLRNGSKKVLHFGRVTQARPFSDSSDRTFTIVSTTQPYLFGNPIFGMYTMDRQGDKVVRRLIDGPLIFNPKRDGITIGNMSQFPFAGSGTFLDAGSSESAAALTYRGEPDVPLQWTLAEAARYLWTVANPKQKYIRNWQGQFQDLENLFRNTVISHVEIPYGAMLPQALDALLEPYGFSWFVEYLGPGARRLQFFSRNSLDLALAIVTHQRKGSEIKQELSNCERIDLRYDIADRLVTTVGLQGDFAEVEAAWDLIPAWPTTLDALTEAETNRDSPDYVANPTYQRAWRDWVLNEAGDYVGVRPGVTESFDFTPYQGSEQVVNNNGRQVLYISKGQFSCRRKRFYPTITTNPDGTPAGPSHGVRVQWSTDAGETWEEAADPDIQVLEKECGIRFGGQIPPIELMNAGSDARVRVTATLRTDNRIIVTAGAPTSVNPDEVPVLIDLGNKYHLRTIHESSPFTGDNFLYPEVMDIDLMRVLASQLLQAWNMADCSGQLVLDGCDFEDADIAFAVDLITDINLNLSIHDNYPFYPIIVAVDYYFRQQQMVLTLDTLRTNPLETL